MFVYDTYSSKEHQCKPIDNYLKGYLEGLRAYQENAGQPLRCSNEPEHGP